jgi:hypothetical protein
LFFVFLRERGGRVGVTLGALALSAFNAFIDLLEREVLEVFGFWFFAGSLLCKGSLWGRRCKREKKKKRWLV